MGIIGYYSDVDDHVISEIFVPRYEGIPMHILKADTFHRALVETIKVFHCGHDGVSGVVGKNLNSHG